MKCATIVIAVDLKGGKAVVELKIGGGGGGGGATCRFCARDLKGDSDISPGNDSSCSDPECLSVSSSAASTAVRECRVLLPDPRSVCSCCRSRAQQGTSAGTYVAASPRRRRSHRR